METSSNQPTPNTKLAMQLVFMTTKGCKNRIRLISLIKEQPLNANQLASKLGLNYKAVLHHLKVLEKHNLVEKIGSKYGSLLMPSEFLESNMSIFDEVVKEVKEKKIYQ